jgi:hypothetical protein
MSENEKQHETPTNFEEALASLQPRPDRLDPRWRALLTKEVSQKAETMAGQPLPLEIAPCSAASSHVFACVYCGIRSSNAIPTRRWGWPAAFSAMTVLATSLLLMLIVRPEPQIALRNGREGGPVGGPSAVRISLPRSSHDFDKLCYLGIRQQVLAHGVDSWKTPSQAFASPEKFKEPPLFYRGQLNRLLEQPDSSG